MTAQIIPIGPYIKAKRIKEIEDAIAKMQCNFLWEPVDHIGPPTPAELHALEKLFDKIADEEADNVQVVWIEPPAV